MLNLKLWLLGGTVLLAPSLSFAVDLHVVDEAINVMQKCTGIAQQIYTTPVPQNHAAARLVMATNQKLKLANSPVEPLPVASIHAEYANWIGMAADKLGTCGQEASDRSEKIHALMQGLKALPQTNDKELKVIAAKFQAFQEATLTMAKQVAALSQNPQIQSYIDTAVLSHFWPATAKAK